MKGRLRNNIAAKRSMAIAKRDVRKSVRRDERLRRLRLRKELHEARRSNDTSRCWRLARAWAGRGFGPKGRQYAPPRAQPVSQGALTNHLKKTHNTSHVETCLTNARLTEIRKDLAAFDPEVESEIEQDYWFDLDAFGPQEIRNCVNKKRGRKSTPGWAAPIEVWKLIMNTFTDQAWLLEWGYFLWGPQENRDGEGPLAVMEWIVWTVRLWRSTAASPWQWATSRAHQLNKMNGKEGLDGERTIQVLEPLGQAIMGAEIKYENWMAEIPYFFYGNKRGKRREAAILINEALTDRLKRARVSHVCRQTDIATAFDSPGFEDRLPPLHEAASPSVAWRLQNCLLHQVVEFADVTSPLQETPGPCYILQPGGVPQGGTGGPPWFGITYAKPTREYQLALCGIGEEENLQIRWNGKKVEMGLTVFADDVRKKIIHDPRRERLILGQRL